jgi:uncharacterized protein (TIGR02265 family)
VSAPSSTAVPEPPDFARDVSLDAYLAACPSDATTRGIFFESVQKLVQSELGRIDDALYAGLETRRWSWVQFKTYPLRDFLRLAHNAARMAFPRLPQGEALRRIGWQAYPTFAATMAGRVALFAFGQETGDIVTSLPKSYALALPGSRVSVHRLGANHARVEMRDVYSFAETYQAGVIEGASRTRGETRIQVLVARGSRICDVDFDVQWTRATRS